MFSRLNSQIVASSICPLIRFASSRSSASSFPAGPSSISTTGAAFVTYFADGERKFIFHINNTPAVMARAPEAAEDLKDCRFFHIMGCSLMASIPFGQEILKTMHLLRGYGAKVSCMASM